MATELRDWTTAGLLEEFLTIHRDMSNRRFAFVLGAGASRSSGIPTGGELVSRWLSELHKRLDKEHRTRPVHEWATDENLDLPGFEYARASEFYSQIFELRFRHDPDAANAFLEQAMSDYEPSLGYSILARILDGTRHKVVITTNFDNLVADALSIYTNAHPFICGHEALTGFVTAHPRRPLIAKIHGDLFLKPLNAANAIAALEAGWQPALKLLFGNYTPIVLGYGGNDGSLMGFLDSLPGGAIPGGIYWCYRDKGEHPGERIRRVVQRHNGALIPVQGFDEFMLQLGDQLGYEKQDKAIEARARQKAERYRESEAELRRQLAITDEKQDEKPDEKPDQKPEALALDSTLVREQLLRAALFRDPQNARLKADLALFLDKAGRHLAEADSLFIEAIESDPNDIETLVHAANLVARYRKAPIAAEHLYQRALELDDSNPYANRHYARFLAHVKGDQVEAARRFAIASRGADAHDPSASDSPSFRCATSLYEEALSLRVADGDDGPPLARLKWLFAHGFGRDWWSIDNIVDSAMRHLSPNDFAFYRALLDALLDADRMPALVRRPRWKELAAIPMNDPMFEPSH